MQEEVMRAVVYGTASERNHDYLRRLGAHPIAYGDGLAERVRAQLDGPVDAVADFAGGTLRSTLAMLDPDGVHVSIADSSAPDEGGRYIWVRPDGAETARPGALADQGRPHVDVARTSPLERVADAFRASAEGHTRGKLVIVP